MRSKPNSFAVTCTGVLPLLVLALGTSARAQARFLKVAGRLDAVDAPSSNALPGLRGAFREQVFIGESRLLALKGQGHTITGLAVRRDLGNSDSLQGGQVRFTIRLSQAPTGPGSVSERFAANAPAANQVEVFNGVVAIPASPSPGPNTDPWSSSNSFTIPFAKGFPYAQGTLCIDMEARPVTGSDPGFWYVDHESVASGNFGTAFGKSCSSFQADGETLFDAGQGLQIGNSIRLLCLGRPGSNPLLLFGAAAIPQGVDLTPTGATGCSLFVSAFITVGLRYAPKSPNFPYSFANFEVQVPPATPLLGTRLFAQSADLETTLPRSEWSNPAGLTTSNGLALQLASIAPSLGLSTVTSDWVTANQPMPTHGRVDVERAPVLRLLYR